MPGRSGGYSGTGHLTIRLAVDLPQGALRLIGITRLGQENIPKASQMSATTKFTRKVAVGFLFAVFLLGTAKAQVPEQYLRIFNSLRQLQQQQQFQRPIPPAASTLPQSSIPGGPNISSSKPTIDCSKTQAPLALILCTMKMRQVQIGT
jgi:hypothetical protein